MIIYTGKRLGSETMVSRMDEKEARLLSPRTDLHDYSGGTFDWGRADQGAVYQDAVQQGSMQLALALLSDLYDENQAISVCESFCREVITTLSGERWSLTDGCIKASVERLLPRAA